MVQLEVAAAQMQQLVQALARDIDSRLCEHQLTLAQRRALTILSQQALTPSAVALALKLDAGATTRLLDRLLAKRLCQGQRDNADRRSVQLQVTELGQSVLDATQGTVTAVLRDWFLGVEDSELEALRNLLARLLAARA